MGLLNPHNPLMNTIIIYIVIIILLIYYKPKIIYDTKTKKFKQFGLNKGKSILSLPILAILIAIITYIIFFYIESSALLMASYQELLKNK